MKKNIFGLDSEEIAALLVPLSMEAYRGKQIAEWLYRKNARSFSEMTNISKVKRNILEENFCIQAATLKALQKSTDGRTTKYLLAFTDNSAAETVLMRQSYGNSVCVSSQVGCAMGCLFCASTLHGMTRSLTAGEMLAQVLYIHHEADSQQQRINNIVIMGSGEPLANYDNVLKFIRLCHEEYCLQLSYRSITLSTAGLIPGIEKLAGEGLPITLSISLHASNDRVRSKLMPINNTYPISSLIMAGDYYAEKTGRRVTYEYTLIANVNDAPEQAVELAALLKGRLANVNLIPVNPVPERGLLRPEPERVSGFADILAAKHINATVRREMGADIQAACGQLRNKSLPKTN